MSKRRSSAPGGLSLSLAPMPDVLKVVADRTRLEILMILARGTKDVTLLTDDLDLGISTVSRHLGILEAFSLVEHEEDGTRHVYGLGRRWTVIANGGMLHLAVTDSEGCEFELRFPEDKVIWWSPQPVTVGRFGLPGRRGG